ncbi:hypothetical protein C8J31_1565 [Rhizobium sp. PP-CC-2G-626]|nr:hypothetical protein C8J31_1565 [Rhizobium sp. PP-CC-2G-626]
MRMEMSAYGCSASVNILSFASSDHRSLRSVPDMISMRAMQPLRSGINVSTNAGSNARTSPDLPDQQNPLTGRLLCIVSWRVLWMTLIARAAQDADPSAALTPSETAILDRLVPDGGNRGAAPHTLHFYIKACGARRISCQKLQPPAGKHGTFARLAKAHRHSNRGRNPTRSDLWIIARSPGRLRIKQSRNRQAASVRQTDLNRLVAVLPQRTGHLGRCRRLQN